MTTGRHLAGSVGGVYRSWSRGCEFEPHDGCRDYFLKVLKKKCLGKKHEPWQEHLVWLVFDQTTDYHNLSKLTHKINHHKWRCIIFFFLPLYIPPKSIWYLRTHVCACVCFSACTFVCVPVASYLNSSRAPRKEDPMGVWWHSTTTRSGLTWECQSTRCQCWPLWERRPTPSATRWGLLLSTAGESQGYVSKPTEWLLLTGKPWNKGFAKLERFHKVRGVKLRAHFQKYWSWGSECTRLRFWLLNISKHQVFLWCLLFYLIVELDF